MPGNNSGRVLIADDDALVRALLRQMIEPAGMTIVEAANGREALELSANSHIDLAVVDLVMPEVDGLETIREMLRRHPDMKIIAVSGALPAHYLDLAARLGARIALPKPIRAEELLEAVTALLREKS